MARLAHTVLRTALCAIFALTAAMSATPARAAEPVDLLLILASDVSRSVDTPKFQLQREGYAAAMQVKEVALRGYECLEPRVPPGGAATLAPKAWARSRLSALGSATITERAPFARSSAHAVRPRTPAPKTKAVRPTTGPAARSVAATVAVAQLARAATASGMASGT